MENRFEILLMVVDYLHNCPPQAQKLNSSALFNGGTSAPPLAIYCWQQLILVKMKIEFIYTYQDKPQEILSYPFVLPILESKETLTEYALSDLLDEEKQQLVKISSCVYFENKGEVDLPNWFNECNGKLWFENGVSV